MSLIVRAPSLRLSLQENAFDFLAEGVKRFARRANSSDLKYAILNIAQATELFLKARLAREHNILVFVDPGNTSSDSPTVGIDAAIRRLHAAGIRLTPRDTADLATIRKHRNCLLHYQIDVSDEDAEASFGRAVSFLDRFLPTHLSVTLDEHLPDDTLFIARKAGHNYEEALVLAQDRLKQWLAEMPPAQRAKIILIDCSQCGQPMLPYPYPNMVPPNRTRCYFCDQWGSVTMCKSCSRLTSFGDTCEHCSCVEL